LAKEDARFLEHHGIERLRMLKAARVNLIAFSTAQGAGTLTQQSAGRFLLSLEKTWIRKIGEIPLAFY
jgi:penicillin-binding protein 1A